MTDKFDAQLRQYLLGSANERPADGQLAAIVDAVAATSQRTRLVARLTWNPGRVGHFPAAAFRYGVIAVALALATAAGAMLAGGGGSGPSTVFEGSWTAVDPGDGSGLTLVVGSGSTPVVYFEDGYAAGEACVNDAVKRFTARGTGEISGSRLVATFPDGGGCGLETVAVAGVYQFEERSDTLSDEDGVVWTRVLGGRPADTRVLATTPEPDPSSAAVASADPNCIQFDAAGTYTAPVGSVSLTVDMPGSVAEPWNGERDGFDVMRAACTDWSGQGWIDAGIVTVVDTNACVGGTVSVATAAEAVAAVAGAKGITVLDQTEVAVGGYVGTRFDIRVPEDPNPCPDGQIPLVDAVNPVDPGVSLRLYLIDVDGTTLALGLFGYADWDPPVRASVDGIIASMQIEP